VTDAAWNAVPVPGLAAINIPLPLLISIGVDWFTPSNANAEIVHVVLELVIVIDSFDEDANL
jgi:hypothetical protein